MQEDAKSVAPDIGRRAASLTRAVQRIELGARALAAAADDLHVAGATAAAKVIGEEADRVVGLAEEVGELARVS